MGRDKEREAEMDVDKRYEKLQLVWASVYLMACALIGFAILVASSPGSEAIPMAVAIVACMFVSVFTVPFLLLSGGAGSRLLIVGRVLVSLQMFFLMSALGIALMIMVG